MVQPLNLIGKRFERLRIISRAKNSSDGRTRWDCVCDCGNTVIVTGKSLVSGVTRSCGCLNREVASITHIDDLIGERYGRLTVLSRAENKKEKTRWLCKCDCGNKPIVRGDSLKNGNTQSCGCLHGEKVKQSNSTHGMSKTRPYRIWHHMQHRCNNPNNEHYADYGGRGIKVCDRWMESFENFWEDMGPMYREGLTIDRKDNNGNYEPGNCRWATHKEQNRNQRSNIIVDSPWGKMCVSEFAEKIGISPFTLYDRISHGRSIE